MRKPLKLSKAARLRKVLALLEQEYGRRYRIRRRDPLEELIFAILNNRTTGAKASTAYEKLSQEYVDRNDVRVTDRRDLAATISGVGMHEEKSSQILRVLNDVFNEHHAFDLDFLSEYDEDDARKYLERMSYLEPFVVNDVLLYALGFNAFVIDEDVVRVVKRLGLVERHLSFDGAVEAVQEIVPQRRAGTFSMLVSRHGREVCTPRNCRCRSCVLRSTCDFTN